MRGAGVKSVSPAKRGRSGATRLEAGEHTRTLTVRRCPSTTTTSCGRRKLRIRHFLAVANRRLVKHARYYWLLLAEGHLTRRLLGAMLDRIWALPVPGG